MACKKEIAGCPITKIILTQKKILTQKISSWTERQSCISLILDVNMVNGIIIFSYLIAFSCLIQGITSSSCSFPAPAKGFSNDAYKGKWFEIGKIQTAGGAFFEKDCVCTELNISIKNERTGDGIADNDCRSKTIDGPWTNVTGRLINEDMTNPGRWEEVIYTNSVNYTVIAVGTDFAVEYDCGTSSAGITNYCIHVMSRTRTMDQSQFNDLINMAESMGLNPQKLPVKMTVQDEKC